LFGRLNSRSFKMIERYIQRRHLVQPSKCRSSFSREHILQYVTVLKRLLFLYWTIARLVLIKFIIIYTYLRIVDLNWYSLITKTSQPTIYDYCEIFRFCFRFGGMLFAVSNAKRRYIERAVEFDVNETTMINFKLPRLQFSIVL